MEQICHPTHAQRPPSISRRVHGALGFAPSTPPTHVSLTCFWQAHEALLMFQAVIYYQLTQADVIDHLFLDHPDRAHCPVCSVGDEHDLVLECLQPLSVCSHSESSITPFSGPF